MARATIDEARPLVIEDEAESAGGARRWAGNTLNALQFPVYRLIWMGSFLGFLAFNMSGTAQSVVAFDLTGSNSAVGTVMFGQGLAMLMLNPIGGTIADRFNKRFLLLVTQTVIGGVILLTAVLLQIDRVSIAVLAVGAFTTGSMFAFLGPARVAMLGDVVPRERIGNATALLQVGGNFGRICSPFLAGALLSISVVGSAGTYFIISSILIFVLLFMSKIPDVPPRSHEGRSILDDVRIGLRYARSNKRLLHSLIGFYAVTALGYSFFVLMPGFVKDELHHGTAAIGAMLGMAAVGGLAGSLCVAGLADSKRAPLFLKLSAACAAAGLVLLGMAPSFPAAMIVMILAGGGVASFQTLNNSVALRHADPEYYGRIMGLMQIAWGLINLLSLPTGALADALSERTVLSGAGVILGVVILLLMVWERRIDGDEPAPVEDRAFAPT
jgi:MFS family permease